MGEKKRQLSKKGFSLLEVLIALIVVAVALVTVLGAIVSMMKLTRDSHDKMIAVNAARQKLAELQSAPFQNLFSLYGPTNTQNNTFTVSGLESGSGKLVFPINANGVLDETITDVALGMPQDMNGNGQATDTNVNGTFTVLPVRIQITWTSPEGARELKMNTMLTLLK